ncbi:hypothetical protein PAXRUDRAFT_64621, partial [Paxillus rubicundulus Ve08.2h10]
NHKSAQDHSDFILAYIQSEVRTSHYSSPFSPDCLESLISSFYTGPLGVVPKPGSLKLYLIQDH